MFFEKPFLKTFNNKCDFRYPLMLELIANMLSYYIRLHKTDDTLLQDSYLCSKSLMEEYKTSWVYCVKEIIKFLNIDHLKLVSLHKKNKQYIYSKLHEKYNSIWKNELLSDDRNSGHSNKLRTYKIFKQNFSYEEYLSWGTIIKGIL